jgi:hypothetical protein
MQLPVPFLIERWAKKTFDMKQLVKGFWGASAVSLLMVILICLVMLPIEKVKADDKICHDAYGQRWDHQSRDENGDSKYKLVCINVDTKEEKPVPKK